MYKQDKNSGISLRVAKHAEEARKGPDNFDGYHHPIFYFHLSHIQDAAIANARSNGGNYGNVLAISRWGGLEDNLSRVPKKYIPKAKRQIAKMTEKEKHETLMKYIGMTESFFE